MTSMGRARLAIPTVVCLSIVIWVVMFRTGGTRCSSVVRAFVHGVLGLRIDPS